ncbi:prolyl oligopeptidase family serine peptidase [Collimonas pratensis]|uniref:dienelactone hydrolase family protein n=1 Tax=Collimonas pratensis TaxID=279113 RepID=UPI00143D6D36|nr:dienelactone hydrolase family protein [Collimonas pratensis]NKI71458.1 prolyl oligopeptidase family serine peptidase [Collimonas pratensis]
MAAEFISRRSVLMRMAALVIAPVASAARSEDVKLITDNGTGAMTRFAANVEGVRPAVILLHGSRGIELNPGAYIRHAEALVAVGVDAYLVRYFSAADSSALAVDASTSASRDAYSATRFTAWADAVSLAISEVRQRSECSGKIGLLGFSLGGYVAAATAARDARVSALAVMYGGMPPMFVEGLSRLPPLLALHGNADTIVPLSESERLVALARKIGATANLVVYPGKKHGFDFDASDPTTADVVSRVARFFKSTLESA